MEVGLGPGDFVLDADPPSPSPKRGHSPKFSAYAYCGQKGGVCPIFGSFLLWPNGWMHQDASAQATMSQMGTQLPPPKKNKWGHSSQFSAHVYCGQRDGWIKMPLGTKVGLQATLY